MKQQDIIKVYNTLESLANNENLHAEDQFAIYKLRKELRQYADFQKEREDKMLEKYKPFADENGLIKGEKYVEYMNDVNDLNNVEVNIDNIEKISLPLVDGINFLTMEVLEPVINFEKK